MAELVKGLGSRIEFSAFGKSTLAYVRPVSHEELPEDLAQEEGLEGVQDLWGLFGADGEPLALSGEVGVLYEDAEAHNLVALQLN